MHLSRRRGTGLVAVLAALAVLAAACTSSSASDDAAPPERVPQAGDVLPTPDTYASRDGVLHLRMRAHQRSGTINGHSYPNLYGYDTAVVDGKGTFTPGTASEYIGPRWHIQPGDRLVIDYVNDLPDTPFARVGTAEPEPVPQPINLHTHGLTVSPAGNSDNVLLSIPPGRSNRFTIDVPADHSQGLFWYHPHIHGLTDDQVYTGLAGEIVVGRLDGNYADFDGIEHRSMMLRYNVTTPGDDGELVDASAFDTRGTALAPRGRMIYTANGVVAPRVEIAAADPGSGRPAESQVWAFTNVTGSASYVLALDEIDADLADDPQAVGTPRDLVVVAVDGTTMTEPRVLGGDRAAQGYLLGQGGRVALLVDGPSSPDKVVRVVQVENRSGTGSASAYEWPAQRAIGGWRDYTRDVFAVSVDPGDRDRAHVAVPETLTTNWERREPDLVGATVAASRTFTFDPVSPPSPETPNNFGVNGALFGENRVDQPRAGTVEEWTILNHSSLHHPFHVHTQFAQVMEIVAPAPTGPLADGSGDEYPTVQVVTDLSEAGPPLHRNDVVNVPPAQVGPDGMPVLGPDGLPVAPGKVVLRLAFSDYLGAYVEHCHRLPHEDRGMMSVVRTIPADPVVAAVVDGAVEVRSGTDGSTLAVLDEPAVVDVAVGDVDGDTLADVVLLRDGPSRQVEVRTASSGWRDALWATDAWPTAASLAAGDLNGDTLDDVVVGDGRGGSRVQILDGLDAGTLADGPVYDEEFTGGVSVAVGMVEDGGRNSLVVGSGPGMPAEVRLFNVDLYGDADGVVPDHHESLAPLLVATQPVPAAGAGGVDVAIGWPMAADGGFASILATPVEAAAGDATLTVLGVVGHDHGHSASASGVAYPHLYDAAASRQLAERDLLPLADVGAGAGATVAVTSTPAGARVLVAPVGGGPLSVWEAAGRGARLAPVGTAPAALAVASM